MFFSSGFFISSKNCSFFRNLLDMKASFAAVPDNSAFVILYLILRKWYCSTRWNEVKFVIHLCLALVFEILNCFPCPSKCCFFTFLLLAMAEYHGVFCHYHHWIYLPYRALLQYISIFRGLYVPNDDKLHSWSGDLKYGQPTGPSQLEIWHVA